MRNGATSVAERVGLAVLSVRSGAAEVAERLPGVAENLRGGAVQTAATFEAMPDPTLRLVTAASVGLGAGLALAGAPRLVTVLALTPALLGTVTAVSRHQDMTRPAG